MQLHDSLTTAPTQALPAVIPLPKIMRFHAVPCIFYTMKIDNQSKKIDLSGVRAKRVFHTRLSGFACVRLASLCQQLAQRKARDRLSHAKHNEPVCLTDDSRQPNKDEKHARITDFD